MKVAVIGAGKMGLPLACVFASRGADVVACDVNRERVSAVNDGICPFEEPGVDRMLAESVAAGRLKATADNREAIGDSNVVVVIVPVMLDEANRANLSIIETIATEMSDAVCAGALVSFETTLPVGQTRKLGNIIARGGRKPGEDFDLVFSPERVKSGLVLRNLFDIPKVVGGITPVAAERGARFYEEYLGAPVINIGTLEAAEFVKLAGMVYRDVNIALANELATYAEHLGIDFDRVRMAANTDGEAAILVPGIGVGGHCTPVYPHFLINEASQRGESVEIAAAGRRLNEEQPRRVIERLGDIGGKSVLILGLGFRPQVKEHAYSPTFALANEIRRAGGNPKVHDPMYSDSEIRRLGLEPTTGVSGHDIVVLSTAHQHYADLDFVDLASSGTKIVVDGRNLWEPDKVRSAGLDYFGIGRPS